jgi:glutathione-independent formaldehyde dehydrogenase
MPISTPLKFPHASKPWKRDIRSNYANWYSSKPVFTGAAMAGAEAWSGAVYIAGRASRSSVCLKLSIIRCSYCNSRWPNEETGFCSRQKSVVKLLIWPTVSAQEQIAAIVGIPEVDYFVDCVGFEASGTVQTQGEKPAVVLNRFMAILQSWWVYRNRYCTWREDPGATDEAHQTREP